ncbi:transcriptional regulator [Shewanella sp. OPT22]|nr:transcriptional regulator [Shewanella sp. OPT22]
MKTTEKILNLLKLNGPLTAKFLAEELKLTTMGVRQHLQALEDSNDVVTEDIAKGRGRPSRHWRLVENNAGGFEDRHEELTLQLIDSVKVIFGDEGLERLIKQREADSLLLYKKALEAKNTIKEKVITLAELRTQEGYMATWSEEGTHFWLLENHCPICAAATKCQSFCRSELELFQALFLGVAQVFRTEHIVDGARRCAYKIQS